MLQKPTRLVPLGEDGDLRDPEGGPVPLDRRRPDGRHRGGLGGRIGARVAEAGAMERNA